MTTPWEVLGIREEAPTAEVRAAYRRLSRCFHPDRFVGAPADVRAEAHAAMADVNAAHDVLLAASRGWAPKTTPPSTGLVRYRPRNRWDAELAPEPARGRFTDAAA